MNTNAPAPTRHIVGLNSFLPNKHNTTPKAQNMKPHRPVYLFKNDQMALIEATEQPLVEFTVSLVKQGSEL